MLLSLRSMKRHSPNSGLEAENLVYPQFHSSRQTLLLEPRHTKGCNCVMDCSVSNSLACKGSVPGEGLASLILLEWQTGVQICVLLCISFFARRSGPIPLTLFTIGLCGVSRGGHRSLWGWWHWKVNCQCTARYHFPFTCSRKCLQGLFTSVWMCWQAKPGYDSCLQLVWSHARQNDKGVSFACCESAYLSDRSRAKLSGPFFWLY